MGKRIGAPLGEMICDCASQPALGAFPAGLFVCKRIVG